MKQKALIVWGGWEGHEPDQVAELFSNILKKENFEVEVSDTLDSFDNGDKLKALDLIIPIITMSDIEDAYVENVSEAVAHGVGLAGCHGGMCDTFRKNVLWAFMTGGTWVSHPGGDEVEYTVNLKNSSSPLIDNLEDFSVKSEQYYLHVDPAVEVLATTRFPQSRWYHSANGFVDMPTLWTKRWGLGRIFYCALGHQCSVLSSGTPRELMQRGLLWAAEGKRISEERSLDPARYQNDVKNF